MSFSGTTKLKISSEKFFCSNIFQKEKITCKGKIILKRNCINCFMKNLILFLTFYEFFQCNPNITFTKNTRIISGHLFTHINFCIFINLKNSKAAAIYITQNINLLIENSQFKECISTNYGGAIYYSSNSGEFILNKNCGSYCFTGPLNNNWEIGGQFSSSSTGNDFRNELYLCSMIFCSNKTNSGTCANICMMNGKINTSNLNTSSNIEEYYSSFLFSITNSMNMIFSNIINNIVDENSVICFVSGQGLAKSLNIINNSCKNGGIIHVCCVNDVQIHNSVINSNNGDLVDLFNCFFTIKNSIIFGYSVARGSDSISKINILYKITQTIELTNFICEKAMGSNFFRLYNSNYLIFYLFQF